MDLLRNPIGRVHARIFHVFFPMTVFFFARARIVSQAVAAAARASSHSRSASGEKFEFKCRFLFTGWLIADFYLTNKKVN